MPAPIEVHCPECQATLKLKNRDAVGRRVPCPKCKEPFVIALPAEDELEVLDELDEFDEFDEFDEAEDFGDLDEVSSTSTRSRPAAKKSSGKKVWIIVGSVLGLGILGVGGYFGAMAMGWLGGGNVVAATSEGVAPAAKPAAEVVKPPPPAEVGQDELDTRWLPPDAQVVGSINLGRIWDGALAQQSLNDATLGPQLKLMLDEMKKETILGLDEISKITVGISGVADVAKVALSGPDGSGKKEAVEKASFEKLIPAVVIRLRNAVTPAHLAAMGQKMEKTTLDGKTVFVFHKDPGEPRGLVYQVDDKTVVFSVERFIKQLIANGDPYTPRPDLAFVDGSQDFVVAVTLPEPLTIPLPPGFSGSPNAQQPAIQSLLGLNGKLKGLGFGLKTLEDGSMALRLQGLSSDEAGSMSGKVALEEALKMGQQFLVPLKQNTFIAEQIKPLEDGLNGSKVTQTGPEFGFLAAFKMPQDQNLLAGLLMPAIQDARDAARNTQCQNNLKYIGVGMHNYSTARKSFPAAAITSKDGKPLLSWRVSILPYIDQTPLYDKFKLDEPWDSPTNKALISLIPNVYVCPSGTLENGMTSYRLVSSGKSAYKNGLPLSPTALASLGGLANVPLVVDAGDEHAVAWTNPRPFDSTSKIGDHHGTRGVPQLFVDGSVRTRREAGDITSLIDSFSAAEASDPSDDGSKDQARIQGAWIVTAARVNGKAVDSMVNQVFTFRNNQLLQQVTAGQQPLQSTFQINFAAKPRTFDWVQAGNRKFMGLYGIDRDRLMLTVALPGQPRPTGLNMSGASILQLLLKRQGGDSVSGSSAPGTKPQGQPKTLGEALKSQRLAASVLGQNVAIQLNSDGTTIDHEGKVGTYSIEGLVLTWKDSDGINIAEFKTPNPKVGDMFSFRLKKKPDGPDTFGPAPAKIVEIKLVEKKAKPKPAATRGIEGTWRVVSAVVSSKPSDSLKGRTVSFAEGKAALNVKKLDAIEYRFSYEVNLETKPATFEVFNGENLLQSGVFRFQGNRLQMCFVRGEKVEPPRDFTATGATHTLYVLEAVKTP